VADTPPEPPPIIVILPGQPEVLWGQDVWHDVEFDDSLQLSAGAVDGIECNRCGAIAESSDVTLGLHATTRALNPSSGAHG
jgi:hypothetical protein